MTAGDGRTDPLRGSSTNQPDPYLPDGLLIPRDVARLLWPVMRKAVQELYERGSRDVLGAAGPVIWRWARLAEQPPEMFADEPPASTGQAGQATVDGDGHRREIDTADAADRLGATRQHVTRLLRRGDLDGRKVGRTWIVERRSVDALAELRTDEE